MIHNKKTQFLNQINIKFSKPLAISVQKSKYNPISKLLNIIVIAIQCYLTVLKDSINLVFKNSFFFQYGQATSITEHATIQFCILHHDYTILISLYYKKKKTSRVVSVKLL